MTDARDPAAARAVYYDGACPICRAEIAQYRKMRGAEAIDWTDVSAQAPADLDQAEALARFHIRRADGQIVSGFKAFLAVWRATRLRRVAIALDRQPFLWLGERLYRGALLVRPLWRRPGREADRA